MQYIDSSGVIFFYYNFQCIGISMTVSHKWSFCKEGYLKTGLKKSLYIHTHILQSLMVAWKDSKSDAITQIR